MLASDIITDINTTTITADVGTVASNFTVNDVRAAVSLGGALVDLDLYINTSNAVAASGGNLADTTMFTLVDALRPSHAKSCSFGNGSVGGEAIINTDGTINLRSASDTVTAGSNIRLSACYLRG